MIATFQQHRRNAVQPAGHGTVMHVTTPLGRPDTSAPADERFRSLFAAHYPAIAAYAIRRLGRPDGHDAAAEVFTVAWRKLGKVPSEPETLPWLYGVARNVVRNVERSRRRRDRLTARAVSVMPATASTDPESDDEVLQALDRLSAADREVLRLHAWEDLGPADIATVMNISAGTAAVRLHRARRRLAAELEQGVTR